MSAHDAESAQESGGAQRSPLPLALLPWPTNLFGEYATIAELMAEADTARCDYRIVPE